MASINNFSRVWAATAAAILTAVSLLLAHPAQAAAQSSPPDASVESAPPGTQDAFCFTAGRLDSSIPAQDSRFVQTFTAGHSGQLTSAQMEVVKGTLITGDYVLEIRTVDASGVPTSTILASTTIANSTVPLGNSVITGTFASPATVVAGAQYAISVGRPTSPDSLIVVSGAPDPCSGKGYFANTSAGPFTETIFGGSAIDLAFAIFVTVAPPPPGSPPPSFSPGTGTSLTGHHNRHKHKGNGHHRSRGNGHHKHKANSELSISQGGTQSIG